MIDRYRDFNSPEMQHRMRSYVDKWIKIGLSCEPIPDFQMPRRWVGDDYHPMISMNVIHNESRIRNTIRKVYEAGGLQEPRNIIVCDSPLAGCYLASWLRLGEPVSKEVVNEVIRKVDRDTSAMWIYKSQSYLDPPVRRVLNPVVFSMWEAIREILYGFNFINLSTWIAPGHRKFDDEKWYGKDVFSRVRMQATKLAYGLPIKHSEQLGVEPSAFQFGAHQAATMVGLDFLRNHTHIPSIAGLIDLSEWCGWWMPYRETMILQHRPCKLHRDDNGSLHNESAMAIEYRDGWGLYSWHGVRVPAFVITAPETITVKLIEKENNAEIRRVMIERYGWERYITNSHAKIIDTRFNERDQQWERLYQLHDGTKRMVVSDPSTGRKYALGVPRGVDKCEQGQAFLSHGLDARCVHRS